MISYLAILIERSIKHKDKEIRLEGLNELKNILSLISKSSGVLYIDKYKDILDIKDKKRKNKDKGDTFK